ncbi:hypothetical protein [Maribacter ulvicola]|uniref:Uncharacterized protein n=1 Tax=Maribacter ulvicola TaxID=228959 RepID=A0A1N6ZJU7_9FLAO|nr:hypothetical protein [Maribacter ulvicola]SIR27078.1 hypothetical protein SAMN05421797_10913 [Maribacter ulvicola]
MEITHFKNLKRILLLSTVLFSTNLFSQDLPQTVYKNVVKQSLNSYYLDDNEKTFNAYNDNKDLNLDLEFNIDLTMTEINEINEPQILVEKSKEFAFTIISEISQSDLMETISDKAKYENINLNFITKTKDYKYIKHNFSIDVKALKDLSSNMNKNGFYRILKKK